LPTLNVNVLEAIRLKHTRFWLINTIVELIYTWKNSKII